MRLLAALLLLLLCLLLGCVAAQRMRPRTPEFLWISNSTTEVVRVYLEVNGWPVLVGRGEPFRETAMRVPAPLAQSIDELRIMVVTNQPTLEPATWAFVRSERLLPAALFNHVWHFSGITLLGRPR